MSVGALISGGLQTIASFGNSLLQNRQQRQNIRRTNRANMELAKFAHQKDVEMWERMQEYNTPAEQMKRFREAGLNPNLIYGQGTPGNVDSYPTFTPPRQDFTGKPPPVDLEAGLTGFHQGFMRSTDRSIVDQKVNQEVNQTWISGYKRQMAQVEATDASRANQLASHLHGAIMNNPQRSVKIMYDNWVSKMTAQEVNNSRTVLLNELQIGRAHV